MKRVLSVFGTRPEAIKMAPVVLELARRGDVFESRVCVTGQHREMLDPVLRFFGIRPDHDLDILDPGQTLGGITSKVLAGLDPVLASFQPDEVLVHGDTTTALAASLAAYYRRIPVAHVEAGLRTGDRYAPWPEEMNRHVADVLAARHFAPTEGARKNLLAEGTDPARILVTGNTVIDAMNLVVEKFAHDAGLEASIARGFPFLEPRKRLLLVTGHRRESFGAGLAGICEALKTLAGRHPDVQIVYPVHLNPNVREPVHRLLGGVRGIHLVEPQDYAPFVYLMRRAHHVLTDSGGIQEEAPTFGKPVLVMRNVTERPEAVEAGTAKLVGTDARRIVAEATKLLTDRAAYDRMAKAKSPFGDGTAAVRIVDALEG